MSASHSFSLFSRFSPFFPTQEDLQNFFDSPQVFCLSLPSARRHSLFLYTSAASGEESRLKSSFIIGIAGDFRGVGSTGITVSVSISSSEKTPAYALRAHVIKRYNPTVVSVIK